MSGRISSSAAPTQTELEALAARVGVALGARGQMLATAESCTGGWAAQCLTAIAGSSEWFERGFVTYSNAAKQELLGVDAETLALHGAVSEATAAAMAAGALAHSHADWALAITGVAGPGGGSADKPVGLVCFAWAGGEGILRVSTRRFAGGRAAVRGQAAAYALAGLLDALGCNGDDGGNGSGTNVAEAAGVMSA